MSKSTRVEDNRNLGKKHGSRRQVDAHDSWLSFVGRSKRLQNDKQTGKKRKNKRTQRLVDVFQSCPPGPPGPRGPPGPQGQKGAAVTLDVMMQEFTELVKETSEKRARELCSECVEQNSTSSISDMLGLNDGISSSPRLTAGFHMRLRRNSVINGKSLMELDTFQQPFAAGSFYRGNSFNIRTGRFTAPVTGIYQLSVNLHIRVKKKGRRGRLKRRDVVTSLICINSLCQHHASLQHLVSLENNSRMFTASFSGFLHLQEGQYASVYVDNASNLNIVAKGQSDFSGVLIGT